MERELLNLLHDAIAAFRVWASTMKTDDPAADRTWVPADDVVAEFVRLHPHFGEDAAAIRAQYPATFSMQFDQGRWAQRRDMRWQDYWEEVLKSHPLVVGFSLTPQPWRNEDESIDTGRLCLKVSVAQRLEGQQLRDAGLPDSIEDHAVQYSFPPDTAPPTQFASRGDSGSLIFTDTGAPVGLIIAVNERWGTTLGCPASEIERLLNASFTPPEEAAVPPRADIPELPNDRCARFDILVSGISIGHGRSTAGTLGCFVWDKDTGEVLALTCAHVAAPKGAQVGDPIYQPGPSDIRTYLNREPTSADIAGTLARWQPISFSEPNTIDAAVFRPTRPFSATYVFGIGHRTLARPTAAVPS